MIRLFLAVLLLTPAVTAVGFAADAPPVELVLLGGDKPARLELRAEVDGESVTARWDTAFAKLHAFFDRDGNGTLDKAEAARLPSVRSLRQAMGNGFTPPVGDAPTFADLDRDGDGRVSVAELAAYYRSQGIGSLQIGVGRQSNTAALTAALLKHLDTDGDGKVSEKEWKAAADSLKKLDANDDELIGAGELVPKLVYPGAAGTLLLTSPSDGQPLPDTLAKLPLVRLPADAKDRAWQAELARREPKWKGFDFTAWRAAEPAAKWVVKLSTKTAGTERFAFDSGRLRIDGWLAVGGIDDAVVSARSQLVAQFENGDTSGGAGGGRRRVVGLDWLTAIADRNGDGMLDRKELDAWLALQAEIAKAQVFVTVLDGGGLFELLDANHDGALSARELRGAWDRLKERGCVAGGAFDPTAVPNVLLFAASRGYPKTLALDARRGPAWFRAMDRNGDGEVSRKEFTGPTDAFDKLDTNKDGFIDADEAEKAKQGK